MHRSSPARAGLRGLITSTACFLAGAATAGAPPTEPGDPVPGLTVSQLLHFAQGRLDFDRELSVAEGRGPIYKRASCELCHTAPIGGDSVQTMTWFGRTEGAGAFDPLLEVGGPILQPLAIALECEEQVPMAADVVARRQAPSTLGAGLVEAIDDADLVALALAPPRPGISGRAHVVETYEDPGVPRVGRFGAKAAQATVLSFSAAHLRDTIGVTNRFLPTEHDPNGDVPPELAGCDQVADPEDGPDGEGRHFIDRVTSFQRYLAPPPQTPRAGMAGEAVFHELGCASCHVASFTTSDDAALEDALRDRAIRPYGDFLLHDMGTAADAIAEGDAGPSEMRTPPLWGLRTRARLWHDGRFQGGTFESRVLDAIAAHAASPEATAAGVIDAFEHSSPDERAQLVAFLDSLGRRAFDADGDGTVDLDDFTAFHACFFVGGPFGSDHPCAISDLDGDGDVDPDDFVWFLTVFEGALDDCNGNGVDDLHDLIDGTSVDDNGNGIPDECDAYCGEDADRDGTMGFGDILLVLAGWGPCGDCPGDMDGDGVVGLADLLRLLSRWGSCDPPPTGACCVDGSCTAAMHDDCVAAGGLYRGDGTLCIDTDCAAVVGGCCLGDGTCTVGTSDECATVGGTYAGDAVDCADAGCPPAGACCLAGVTCTVATIDDCLAAGGTYVGDGVGCVSAACGAKRLLHYQTVGHSHATAPGMVHPSVCSPTTGWQAHVETTLQPLVDALGPGTFDWWGQWVAGIWTLGGTQGAEWADTYVRRKKLFEALSIAREEFPPLVDFGPLAAFAGQNGIGLYSYIGVPMCHDYQQGFPDWQRIDEHCDPALLMHWYGEFIEHGFKGLGHDISAGSGRTSVAIITNYPLLRSLGIDPIIESMPWHRAAWYHGYSAVAEHWGWDLAAQHPKILTDEEVRANGGRAIHLVVNPSEPPPPDIQLWRFNEAKARLEQGYTVAVPLDQLVEAGLPVHELVEASRR
jgi:hypothetical protein